MQAMIMEGAGGHRGGALHANLKPYHGGHHGLRAGFDVCVSREMRLSQSFDNVNNATTVCVCELETGPHSTAALMQARPRGACV